MLLTISELLVKLAKYGVHAEHIIVQAILLIYLLGIFEPSLELKVQGLLILLEVDLPGVEIVQLQVGYVINPQEGVEILVKVTEVLLLQLLLGEIRNLCETFQ